MVASLNNAYVLGLLTDAERRVSAVEEALQAAQNRAAAVEGQLAVAAARYVSARDEVRRLRHAADDAARIIADYNGKLTSAHQEMDVLQRRSDELLEAMRGAEGEAQRHIRRNRATLLVSMQDKQKVLAQLNALVSDARTALAQAQSGSVGAADAERLAMQELDLLQQQLPQPHLYLQLFAARAGRAHCVFFLDRQRQAWLRDMHDAIVPVEDVHEALRAGRYRLDTHSDWMGGRAPATADAIYARLAMGQRDAAIRLFERATDPALLFHHIFQVFRCWCLGLYLQERYDELFPLVQLHLYSEGVRGAYAQAYNALMEHDGRAFAMAIKNLEQWEWTAAWRSTERALGVVNVSAVALCRLAAEAGLPMPKTGPSVPIELLR